MSKYISTQIILRGIRGLSNWRSQVDSQGAMHLWHILSAKRQGVNAQTENVLLESHDKAFFDDFMRLQDTKEPYFDPLTSDFRIHTHYHSNVATSRKKTFAAVWKAAEFRSLNENEYWKFSPDYLKIIENKVLTKGGTTVRIPLFSLLSWLYRVKEFPDTITLENLKEKFRQDFHIDDSEFQILFNSHTEETEDTFFANRKTPDDLILEMAKQGDDFDLAESLEMLSLGGHMKSIELEEIIKLVKQGRQQIILQGPPGTGKTFLARQIAAYLLKADQATLEDKTAISKYLESRQFSKLTSPAQSLEGIWEIVQFHPNYNYEDFVRGISATTNDGGSPNFQVQDRIVGLLAKLSTETHLPIILIIDEINRGDLSKVMGS